MSTIGPKTEPNAGDDPTWTNETLPLDVRRALLNQELERFTARRHSAFSCGGGGDHAVAVSEADHRHAGS